MHVNTDGDPTSAVLQYCASGADKFSTVTSATPDHGGLQHDRKLAVEAARRAIILRKSADTEKSPAITAGLFDSLETALELSAWRPG